LVGGLFQHAEIYDSHKVLIAESGFTDKQLMDVHPTTHELPDSKVPSAKLLKPSSDKWFVIIFIPINTKINTQEVLVGYIGLIRHVPKWRMDNIKIMSTKMAILVFVMMIFFRF